MLELVRVERSVSVVIGTSPVSIPTGIQCDRKAEVDHVSEKLVVSRSCGPRATSDTYERREIESLKYTT